MTRASADRDSGFTLIELLVSLTILSVIMGAIAAAVIVGVRTAQTTTNRLSDTTDAEITSAYYVRDVQGATYLIAPTGAPTAPYSATSPEVCPPSNPGTLLLGVYHPEITISSTIEQPTLDVGYWEQNGSITRYDCSLSSTYTATETSAAVIAQHVVATNSSTGAIEPAVIEPAEFQSTTSWVPAVATTYITGVTTSGGKTVLTLESVTGLASSGDVNVATTLGNVLLTGCSLDSINFTYTCSPASGTISAGQQISQNSISDVSISVTQAPTPTLNQSSATGQVEYHYSLSAAPRLQAPWGAAAGLTSAGGISPYVPGSGGTAQTLLTLSQSGVNLSGHNTLTVDSGGAQVDAGSASCGGSSSTSISPSTGFTGSPGVTSSCQTIYPGTYQPDPLAPYLPSCAPAEADGYTTSTGGVLTYTPGRYTATISIPSSTKSVVYFEPGVYELDGGISVKSSSGIEIAPDATGGILFYVPGTNTTAGCDSASTSSASVNLGAQGALGLPPLTEAQSIAAFDGNPNLGGVSIWQDASNSNGASFGGGSSATAAGLSYLPSAIVSLSGGGQTYLGELICAGINLVGGGGGNGLNLTGNT